VKHNQSLALFPDAASATIVTSRQTHLTFKANVERGRHGWLRLTPAYSVHLVEELVAHCGKEDVVLDPFCGTGTTALVCAQAGIPCHTVDINPFLVWLANTKCAVYSQDDREAARVALAHVLSRLDSANHRHPWTPPIKDIGKWWEPETLGLLAQVFEQITSASLSEPARDLLRVIFCRAEIELASVSFGHQSMSFKKSQSLPALFEVSAAERLRAIFQRVAAEVLSSAGEPLIAACGRAFLGDSRQLEMALPPVRYTAVITSPPYPNRISYIRELRPYMYWLGYLDSGRQAGELDWQAIGGTWGSATSNLMRWTPDARYTTASPELQEAVEQIAQQSKVLSRYVAKYFQDTIQHVQSLRRILAPGASVYYIVGNSKFYDVMLHTEQIYATIFQEQGFREVNSRIIRKRTSKKELFEHLVSARA
jgi:DNA modification methylase